MAALAHVVAVVNHAPAVDQRTTERRMVVAGMELVEERAAQRRMVIAGMELVEERAAQKAQAKR
jgi:hypothetical protein